ncbi:MAG: hypothetical protein K1X54_10545 [Flavobacteriales bacterium]|nr:hypothetical protein [Flavobacteriales bacterium]
MRILLFAFIVFLASCAVKTDAVALRKEAEETRIALMRSESDVSGNFYRLRTFHLDLMQVVNHIDHMPYPLMDSLFYDMRDSANAVIFCRMKYDTAYAQILTMSEGRKKFKPTEDETQKIDQYKLLRNTMPIKQKGIADHYFLLKKEYDDSCRVNGIRRFSLPEFAEITFQSLVQWQDSLEAIGKMLAEEKNLLKQKYPSQKGAEFMAAYQPVSVFEKMLKDYESQLAQLENSVSRFEEANKQDYIYVGKDVRRRMESESVEGILGALSLLMKDCRIKHQEFLNSHQ